MDFDIKLCLFYSSATAFSIFLSLCIILIAASKPYPVVTRSKKEQKFLNPKTGKFQEFPSINEECSINLSVIIPAYNEEVRLPVMLNECIEFLEEREKSNTNFSYEIIIVSDGSSDKTVEVSHQYAEKVGSQKIRVLALEKNRGKGGAVRLGIQSARGSVLLFADADGATKFADLVKIEENLKNLINCDYLQNPKMVQEKLAITVGSRAHLEQQAVASRSFFRTILMHSFHFLVWLFAVRGIKDTQCGFKLLTREAAKLCFDSLHVERWAFDVEMLYIAQILKIPVGEVAVNWTEIDGSKVTPVWSWIQMGVDLGLIWLRYTIGAWKIRPTKLD